MKLITIVLPLLVLAGGAVQATPVHSEEYIHPDSDLKDPASGMPDSTTSFVVAVAVDHLLGNEGSDVLVCRMTRIEAPLGGWLVDGLAEIVIDGIGYETFRIGIDDSGDVFTLIARGVDSAGAVHWFPAMGPDFRPGDDEPFPEDLLEFEFLMGRDDFEVLEQEFPRPGPCS